MKRMDNNKKSVYKRWWFWILVLLVVPMAIGALVDSGEENNKVSENTTKIKDDSENSVTESRSTAQSDKLKAEESTGISNTDRSEFYELDKVVNSLPLGNEKPMSYSDFEGLTIGNLVLDALIMKYGAPSNVTGAREGNQYIEVTYPTSESGYSADLTFENKSTDSENWILYKKNAVKTAGINLPVYSIPAKAE